MEIIWSNQAVITYEDIIDNLLLRWNVDVALEFESLTNNILDKLKSNEKLCPGSKKTLLRKCVIHKNSSIVYRIGKHNIEIVTFVFNKSNHSFY